MNKVKAVVYHHSILMEISARNGVQRHDLLHLPMRADFF